MIKKIILTPLFEWKHPDEWGTRLSKTGLYYKITCVTNTGTVITSPSYSVSASPYHYQPVFPLNQPIQLPDHVLADKLYKSDFPMRLTIEIFSSTPTIDFDVMMVYDEG